MAIDWCGICEEFVRLIVPAFILFVFLALVLRQAYSPRFLDGSTDVNWGPRVDDEMVPIDSDNDCGGDDAGGGIVGGDDCNGWFASTWFGSNNWWRRLVGRSARCVLAPWHMLHPGKLFRQLG